MLGNDSQVSIIKKKHVHLCDGSSAISAPVSSPPIQRSVLLAVHLHMALHVSRELLLSGVSRGEEGLAVPPAALHRLQLSVAMVTEQMLEKVLRHPEDQRAAIPPAAIILHQI